MIIKYKWHATLTITALTTRVLLINIKITLEL